MATSVIGALRVMLGMDTAEFEAGTDKAAREAARLERRFKAVGRNMQKIGAGFTAALTVPILGAATAFGASAQKIASESREIGVAAQVAGEQFEVFQRQAFAASKVGIEFDKLGDIFKDVRDRVGDFAATGGGPMADFFENIAPKVGVTAEAFRGLSGKDSLQLYFDSLRKANVSQEEMVFYLEAMASDTTALIPLLENGGKAFEEFGAKANVVSDEDRERLAKFTDAQDKLNQSFEKLTIAVVNSGLLDAFTDLVEGAAGFAESLSETNPTMLKFGLVAAGLAAAIGPVLVTLGSIVTVAPAIAGAIGVIRVAMLGLLANPILLGAAAVITGIVIAWQNWDTITGIVEGVGASVMNWYEQNIKPTMDAVLRVVGAVADFFADYFGKQIKATVALVSALMAGDFSGAWDAAKQIVANSVQAMAQVVQAIGPVIAAAFKAIYDAAKQWLMDKLGDALEFVQRRVKEVEGAFAWLYDKVVGNSWIPDMVAAIGDNMAQLGGVMVRPAISAAEQTSGAFEQASESVQRSFAEMADGALGSLDRLLSGIQRGGVSDILGGLLGIGQTFGLFGGGKGGVPLPTGGALGGGSAPSFDFDIPGFANGGSMRLGGMAGLDRNLLSLNGSPLARVSAGETMTIRPANDGGQKLHLTVTMDESTGALGAFVRDQAGRIVAQAAGPIAQRGANMALGQMRDANELRLA